MERDLVLKTQPAKLISKTSSKSAFTLTPAFDLSNGLNPQILDKKDLHMNRRLIDNTIKGQQS
ncbi:unnamed protein product [Malus baccata var. baccata]|uniref:Uncharacterized protein n=1 Tax=Malus domestica TaxID=3750 RepID=A0A498HU39_MALDO|nr:hypothetical protein DVH24_012087 [Malus domestica]